jgi:hypothetical protein
MNYLTTFANNTSISVLASIFGGIASYSFFEYGFYDIPFIDYEIPTFLIYGAMVGLSSFWLKSTGDFILPLISNNTQLNNLSKLTIPLSVGVMSVATLFVLNGFDIPSINDAVKMILLSGGSYVVADWAYNKINTGMNMNNPNQLPIVPKVPNIPSVPTIPTMPNVPIYQPNGGMWLY